MKLKQKLVNWAKANTMTQLINDPTFFTDHSANIVDLIFTDSPGIFIEHGVLPPIDRIGKVYHCPTYCKLKFGVCKDVAYRRQVWLYEKADFPGLNNAYYNTGWQNILYNSTSVSEATSAFVNTLMNTCKNYIPNKYIIVRPRDKPWMTGNIRRLLRCRDRLYKLKIKSASENNILRCKERS